VIFAFIRTCPMAIGFSVTWMPCAMGNFNAMTFYLTNCIVAAIASAIIYMVYFIPIIIVCLLACGHFTSSINN
jgi:hypothetical protein